MKVKNKTRAKKQNTMCQNSNNQNLSDFMQAQSHTPIHTHTHSVNTLPMIDVVSTSFEPSHEALGGGSGCRHHRPADLERPLRSLSAGPLMSAVMGGSDRDATPDGEHRVSVDVHTEASGADGVTLRGLAVRHHVSDPSDGDMDQAEQPRHYSNMNDETNPNTMLAMRRHPPYHLALTRGLDPHYGA